MRRLALVAMVVVMVAGACGGDDALPEAEPGTLEVSVTRDLLYHEEDGRFQGPGLFDVVAPTEGGPWPVVVAFHGDPAVLSKASSLAEAFQIAERGRVVFVPAWGRNTASDLRTDFRTIRAQVTCAAAVARARAAEFGGDPDHITLYGFSAGGNAALMAGLPGAEPLDICAEGGPAITPQAVVSSDADVLFLAPNWDFRFREDPEAFYGLTPWRYLDRSHDVPIRVAIASDHEGIYTRPVDADPGGSILEYRHTDVDLAAELGAMGLLDDGRLSLGETNRYFHRVLVDAGYDTDLVILPGSTHGGLSAEGLEALVDTIVHAERGSAP
jgi:acetyl esterase/lipase